MKYDINSTHFFLCNLLLNPFFFFFFSSALKEPGSDLSFLFFPFFQTQTHERAGARSSRRSYSPEVGFRRIMIVSDHKTAAKKQRHKFWRHKLEPEFSRAYFSSGTRIFTRTLEDLNCVGMSAGSRNNLNIYIRTESAPKQAENVDSSHDRRRERDAEVRHGGRGPSRRSGRDQEDLRLQRRAAPSPPAPT